jgi:hypothetical protein
MKLINVVASLGIAVVILCNPPEMKASEFDSVSRVRSGKPVSVMLTSYSTTLLANGKDRARLRVAVTDSISREITSANDSIRIYVTGDGKLEAAEGGKLLFKTDTAGKQYAACRLVNGYCKLLFIAGTKPDKIKPGRESSGPDPMRSILSRPTWS